ncbi:hypothetical protein SAY86_026169 [Trapa natans]|uniref:Uncharacterized protein n=1 Tax=Trapa natans TaxID=22666 RepID=A0AAN7QEH5_TRANT|nr:hypothetical protein SAY86_026169 [Trapa natans]
MGKASVRLILLAEDLLPLGEHNPGLGQDQGPDQGEDHDQEAVADQDPEVMEGLQGALLIAVVAITLQGIHLIVVGVITPRGAHLITVEDEMCNYPRSPMWPPPCYRYLCAWGNDAASEVLTEARLLLVENYFQTPSSAWARLSLPLRISGRASS